MEYVVITYLCLAILLYFLLGGADFGVGIVEMFTSTKNIKRTRNTLYHAIGPIWEANHMWLIIAVVILFVGFPVIYSQLSVSLHIPLVVLLLGIIARGTAFVFRHYDAVRDHMQEVYNQVFIWSSFVTPLFLGIIAGSALSGKIDVDTNDFITAYIFSWFNWFSVAVGFFTVALCGFLACVYLIGEAEDEYDHKRFVNKARTMNIAAVICGALVFVAAQADGVPLTDWIFRDVIGLTAVILASLSLIVLWVLIKSTRTLLLRVLAGFQVSLILVAFSYAHFPDFVIIRNGKNLSLLTAQAPEKTMQALGWALLIGSVLILPALFYLYYSFRKKLDDD